jgi:hypothetical protein
MILNLEPDFLWSKSHYEGKSGSLTPVYHITERRDDCIVLSRVNILLRYIGTSEAQIHDTPPPPDHQTGALPLRHPDRYHNMKQSNYVHRYHNMKQSDYVHRYHSMKQSDYVHVFWMTLLCFHNMTHPTQI